MKKQDIKSIVVKSMFELKKAIQENTVDESIYSNLTLMNDLHLIMMLMKASISRKSEINDSNIVVLDKFHKIFQEMI